MSKIKDHKPSMFSIMPGDIVYDKSLTDGDVRVYAAISGVCGREGCTYASNAWFAKKVCKTQWTVSRIVKRLEKKGYIQTVVLKDDGNRRYIMCLTQKQLMVLSKAISIRGDEKVAGLLSSIAIGLLSRTARPYCHQPQDPIAIDDNHREVVREEEGENRPPPQFKKDSKEEKCWNNYQYAKQHFELSFNPNFFDFFEEEVMGRFTKQDVSNATLGDWYNGIWGIYDIDRVIFFLKKQRAESTAWQVKWMQLNNRLKADKGAQDNRKRKEAAATAEKAEPIDPRSLKERDMDLLENNPDRFMERYNTNQFFKLRMDRDPDFKTKIDKIRNVM